MRNQLRRPKTKDQRPKTRENKKVLGLGSWVLGLGSWLGYWLLASELNAPVFAQCAMCRTAAAAQGPQAANAFNHAILILLIPAVAIFCGLFLLAVRYRNSPNDKP